MLRDRPVLFRRFVVTAESAILGSGSLEPLCLSLSDRMPRNGHN